MNSNGTYQKLTKKDGKSLAYGLLEGQKDLPMIVFLGGYRSDMTGTKASFLNEFCLKNNYGFLRFDYSGHGASDGDFRDGCIGDWLNDTLTMINHTTKGDMILIGSSMGGWIGLLAAKILGDKVKSFIGIAAAPDFTDWVWQTEMTEVARNLCKQQGYIETPDGDYFTLKLFEDGAQHLTLDKPLELTCPVTLLHGKLDDVVPYTLAQKLTEHIKSPAPTKIILIEDGDHRLARAKDLEILLKIVEKLVLSSH